jgi:hypothetical protein
MPSDRFRALAHAIAADLGTPGTRDPLARGSNTGSQKAPQNSHSSASGTPGTPGTRGFHDIERDRHGVRLAAGLFGQARNEAAEQFGPTSSLPSDAGGLLHYLRVSLCCRVWWAGDMLIIAPTHRCPPLVVMAAQSLWGELVALVMAEEEDRQIYWLARDLSKVVH